MLNDWLNTFTLNSPPYIPIPFSNGLMYKLFIVMIVAKIRLIITTLENKIDLSRLILTALEIIKKINKDIIILYKNRIKM